MKIHDGHLQQSSEDVVIFMRIFLFFKKIMEKESCIEINDFRFYFHQMKPFDTTIRKENVQCC